MSPLIALPTSATPGNPAGDAPGEVLREYVAHYNAHRPHRALGLRAPETSPIRLAAAPASPGDILRRDRLGGLIHEYDIAA